MNSILHGTAAEMLVAADLMDKGFEVFHGLSGRESCDLIALAPLNGKTWRVEVKASYLLHYAPQRFDVLAVANVAARAVEYPDAPKEFIDLCGEAEIHSQIGPKGLTARIRDLMRSTGAPWTPSEVATALKENPRACRERMRLCPTMHRDEATGRYYLDEHLRPALKN